MAAIFGTIAENIQKRQKRRFIHFPDFCIPARDNPFSNKCIIVLSPRLQIDSTMAKSPGDKNGFFV